MQTFENFKDYIVKKAAELEACNLELNKAENSTDFKDLFQIIKKNISWSIANNLIYTDILLELVSDGDLMANGFYVKKEFTEFTESNTCLFSCKIDTLNAMVLTMSGTSSGGRMSGTSSVGEMYDTSLYKKCKFGEKTKLYIKKNAFEIIEID